MKPFFEVGDPVIIYPDTRSGNLRPCKAGVHGVVSKVADETMNSRLYWVSIPEEVVLWQHELIKLEPRLPAEVSFPELMADLTEPA